MQVFVQLEEHSYISHRTPVAFISLLQSSLTGCSSLISSITGFIAVDVTVAKLTLDEVMSNALKYRRPDTDIRITARLEDDMLHVLVTNLNPLGFEVLSDEECVRVFQPGYKSHLASAMSDGVGLDSVARAIAAAHGSVCIRCDPDAETTTVCFSLPAYAVATPQEEIRKEIRNYVPSVTGNPRPGGIAAVSSWPSSIGTAGGLRREARTDSPTCPDVGGAFGESGCAAAPRKSSADPARQHAASSCGATCPPTRRMRMGHWVCAKLLNRPHGLRKTAAERRAVVAAVRAVLNESSGASRRRGAPDTLYESGLAAANANNPNTLLSGSAAETVHRERPHAYPAARPVTPPPLPSCDCSPVASPTPLCDTRAGLGQGESVCEREAVPCLAPVALHVNLAPGAELLGADNPGCGRSFDLDASYFRPEMVIRTSLTDHSATFGTSSCGFSSPPPSSLPSASSLTSSRSCGTSFPQHLAHSPSRPQNSLGLKAAAPAHALVIAHARDDRRKLRCVGLDDEDMPRMILRVLFTYHLDADLDASCSIGESIQEQEAFIDVAMGVRNPDLSYTEGEPVQADVVLMDENINESANPPILGSLLSAELRMCGFQGIIVIFTGAPSSTIQNLRSQSGVDLAFGKADSLLSIAADITSLYDQRCAAAAQVEDADYPCSIRSRPIGCSLAPYSRLTQSSPAMPVV